MGRWEDWAWSSQPFLTRGRELISLDKQKLRASGLMNRLALSKWKAGSLETAAATEELKLRGSGASEGHISTWRQHIWVNFLGDWSSNADSMHVIHTSFASPCQSQIRCFICPVGEFLEETLTAAIIAQESEQLMTYRASCTWFLEKLSPVLLPDLMVFYLHSAVNCVLAADPLQSLGFPGWGAGRCAQGGGIIFLCYCLLSWHLV